MPLLTNQRNRFLGGGQRSTSYDFTHAADGALPVPLVGATWAVSGGRAVNTPTLAAAANANPGFDSDTAWTKGTNWTIGSGKATHASSASIDLINQAVLTAGQWYRCDWTITDYTSGTLSARFGSSANISNTRNAAATYINTGRADNTTAGIRASTSTTASIDNVTFKQITASTMFAVAVRSSAYGEQNAIWDVVAGTQFGVVMCLDSASNPQNFVIAYCDGNNYIRLDKCVGGTYTNVETTAATAVSGKNLRLLRADGTNTFSVWYGAAGSEVQVGSNQTISDAGIISNTLHGLFATSPAATCQASAWGAYTIPAWTYLGDVLTATVAGDQDSVFEANVIREAGAQILSGTVYKMWYTGGWANPVLNYAESTDGATWTKYGSNPIIDAHYRSMVLKSGSTYYLYAAAAGHTQLDLYTSSDGVAWSLDTAATLPRGSAGAWDDGSVANCHVWIEGAGDWRMLYEAKQAAGSWHIGYATSSDGKAWTKHASNPVITGAGGRGGPWLTKDGSTYHLWAHYSIGGTTVVPTDIYHWTSTDCITWTLVHPWPMIYRRDSAEGARNNVGQCADVFIVDVGGTAHVYYTVAADGTQQSGLMHIRAATVPMASIIATS